MTTKITLNSNSPLWTAKHGNQLPALFNNNWFNSFFTDFDKNLTKAFDVPNVHYPYDILVRSRKDTNTPFEYEVQVALAGVRKEEIAIKVTEGRLNVEINPYDTDPPDDHFVTFLRNGISYRKATLEFSLSKEVDFKKISSKFSDGLLKIRIPVLEPESTNISINID